MSVLIQRTFRFGKAFDRKLSVKVDDNGKFSVTIPKDIADRLCICERERVVSSFTLADLIEKISAIGDKYLEADAVKTRKIAVRVYDDMSGASVSVSIGVFDVLMNKVLEKYIADPVPDDSIPSEMAFDNLGYRWMEDEHWFEYSEELLKSLVDLGRFLIGIHNSLDRAVKSGDSNKLIRAIRKFVK